MTNDQKCPIWGTPADVIENGGNAKKSVTSSRAGGKYIIWDSAEDIIGWDENYPKTRLTNWIVDQNRFGLVPVVNDEIAKRVKSWPILTVVERADRLLLYLDSQANMLGQTVNFMLSDIRDGNPQNTDRELPAWTGSKILYEVTVLIDYCVVKGWINAEIEKRPADPGLIDNTYEIALTVPGYARLAELGGANPESAQGFVAMWFNDSMNEASDAIQKAIHDSGYKPQRIDKKQHINKICDEIIAEIRRSRFVVADFTSEPDKPRGGVYYEAGFAQGLNIPVIWTCRKDLIKMVHFDTNHFNHIAWENPDQLYEQLKNRIEAVIGDGPHKKQGNG